MYGASGNTKGGVQCDYRRFGICGAAVVALVAVLIVTLAVFGAPRGAYAANSAFDNTEVKPQQYMDSYTGNAFLANRDVTNVVVGCDLYWAGQTLNASGVTTGADGSGDALLAGQTISLSNSNIQGSLRAAGQDITITSTKVTNNITVAGQTISAKSEVKAKGLYGAAETLNIAGSYQSAALSGDTVTLSGSFEGDVHVSASRVEVSRAAVVGGTLYVPEDAFVVVDDKAQVRNMVKSGLVGTGPSEGLPIGILISFFMFSCIAHVLLTMVYWYIGKDVIRDAAVMSRERIGSLVLTGLVIFFAAPLVALLLLIPVVTLPLVVLMGIIMVTVWLFSLPFAGAALGCQLFHKMSPRIAALLGTLILTALCYVPYLLPVIPTLTSIYTMGYVGQKFITKRRLSKNSPVSDPMTS